MLLERNSALLFSRSDIIKNVPEITQTTASEEKAMPSRYAFISFVVTKAGQVVKALGDFN